MRYMHAKIGWDYNLAGSPGLANNFACMGKSTCVMKPNTRSNFLHNAKYIKTKEWKSKQEHRERVQPWLQ